MKRNLFSLKRFSIPFGDEKKNWKNTVDEYKVQQTPDIHFIKRAKVCWQQDALSIFFYNVWYVPLLIPDNLNSFFAKVEVLYQFKKNHLIIQSMLAWFILSLRFININELFLCVQTQRLNTHKVFGCASSKIDWVNISTFLCYSKDVRFSFSTNLIYSLNTSFVSVLYSIFLAKDCAQISEEHVMLKLLGIIHLEELW